MGVYSFNLLSMSIEKKCGKCGASFLYQTGDMCWCAAYRVDEGQLTTMGQQYADCLCEECLAALRTPTAEGHGAEEKSSGPL